MRDPLARPATPAVLHRLRDAGVLDEDALRRALGIALRTPSVAAWQRFFDRALLGSGAALVLTGILYFFARNWAELGRLGRFTLVEAAILVAALVAWRGGLDRLTGQVGGLAVTVLAGVALAVVGQSYQLGADPWRLFAITAALGVPWLLASRFAPLFVLLLALVHLALWRWWPATDEVGLLKLLLTSVGIDALAWIAWERLPAVRALAGRWVPRLLAVATLVPLGIGAAWLMVDDRALLDPERPLAWQGAVLAAWIVATVAALWLFARWRPDLFVLALAVVGLILVVSVRLVRAVFDIVDTSSGTAELLLTALVLAAAAGLAATWLRRLQLALPDDDDASGDGAARSGGTLGSDVLRSAASAVATAGGVVSSPPPVGQVLARLEAPPPASAGPADDEASTPDGVREHLARAAAALGARAGEGSPWYVRLLVAGVAWLAAVALFAALGAFFLIDEVSLPFGLVLAAAVPLLARRLPPDAARGAGAEFLSQWLLVGSLAARLLVAVGVHALGDSTSASLVALAALEVWLGVTVPDRLQRFLAAGLACAWLFGALVDPSLSWLPAGAALPVRTGLYLGIALAAGWLWLARARSEAGAARAWHAPVAYGLTAFVLVVPGIYSFLTERLLLVEPRAASAGLVVLLLVLWWSVLRDLDRPPTGPVALVVAALVVGLGLAAWREPGLLAAFGALALAFHVRARRLAGLAIAAVVAFLCLYYYHLPLDFFTKALVIAGSGLVLLAGRWALLRGAERVEGAPPAVRALGGGHARARRAWAAVGLLAVVGVVNAQIVRWERLAVGAGAPVYLELAPIDPRSLVQGDYVALGYALNDYLDNFQEDGLPVWQAWPARGTLAVTLDERRVGVAARWHGRGAEPLEPDEIPWAYRQDGGRLTLAPDAWFVPEGTGVPLETTARYGIFRVDAGGQPLLIGLADDGLAPITAPLPRWWRGPPPWRRASPEL